VKEGDNTSMVLEKEQGDICWLRAMRKRGNIHYSRVFTSKKVAYGDLEAVWSKEVTYNDMGLSWSRMHHTLFRDLMSIPCNIWENRKHENICDIHYSRVIMRLKVTYSNLKVLKWDRGWKRSYMLVTSYNCLSNHIVVNYVWRWKGIVLI